MPRCGLLVWILVSKLAPTSSYYRKLDMLLIETGRYRELSSWRKGFKKTWRKLEKTPITIPINDAYKPNVHKWICTCPSFAHQESCTFEKAMLAWSKALQKDWDTRSNFGTNGCLTPCSARVHHFCNWQRHVWTRRGGWIRHEVQLCQHGRS